MCLRDGVAGRDILYVSLETPTYFGQGLDSLVRRFQRAFEHIQRAEGNLNFADLAGEYGYTDQSHLIRECRLLAGKRPTELLAGLAARPSS